MAARWRGENLKNWNAKVAKEREVTQRRNKGYKRRVRFDRCMYLALSVSRANKIKSGDTEDTEDTEDAEDAEESIIKTTG